MSDLVGRLRKWSVFGYGYEASCDMKEAATAIEAQSANMANAARLLSEQTDRIEQLEAALLTGVCMLSEMGLDPREKCQMAYDYMSAALEKRT